MIVKINNFLNTKRMQYPWAIGTIVWSVPWIFAYDSTLLIIPAVILWNHLE